MSSVFKDRVAIVTGVSSGIGRELAAQLTAAGAHVEGVDVGADPEIKGMTFHRMDVTDRAAWQGLAGDLETHGGRIDYLFNNAGISLLGEAHKVDFDQWKRLLDINTMGVVNGISAVYPGMVRRRSGHVVTTASLSGITGYATAAAYSMSKGFLIGMSLSLAAEAKAYGVKVSVACPSYVRTGIFTSNNVIGADLNRVISGFPAPMIEPEVAAARILRGVARGKSMIVFPFRARLLLMMNAWLPRKVDALQRKLLEPFV